MTMRFTLNCDVEIWLCAFERGVPDERGVKTFEFSGKGNQFADVNDWPLSLDDGPGSLNAHPNI